MWKLLIWGLEEKAPREAAPTAAPPGYSAGGHSLSVGLL